MNNLSAGTAGNLTLSNNLKTKKHFARKPKYFYTCIGFLFLILTFLGFFPSFQNMRHGSLQVHWLTHFHSLVMTSWLLLYLTQTMLIATGNLRIHRSLGILSFAVGISVIITMIVVSFHFLIANHPPEGSFIFDTLLFDFSEIPCFSLLFLWGMKLRKRDSGAHKRLLTLATVALLLAAVDRIQRNNAFPSLGVEYPITSFIYLNILLVPLFVYDFIMLKRIHKITLIGTAIIIFLQVIVNNAYQSPAWHHFCFNLTAPLMEKVVEVNLTDAQSDPLLGDYEGGLGNITISRSNSKLYLQVNGDEKQELGAISATQLFLKSEVMNFFFVKDADERITTSEIRMAGYIFKMTRVK